MPEPPASEYGSMLAIHPMNELRLIARRRGIPVTVKTKAELVEVLGAALLTPESIDAAVAGLTEDERLTLDLADLLQTRRHMPVSVVGAAYQAVGGKEGLVAGFSPAPMQRLFDLALAIPPDLYSRPPQDYTIPVAVRERLQFAGSRLVVPAAHEIPPAPRESETKLTLFEVMQTIVHEVLSGRLKNPLREIEPASGGIPEGWQAAEGNSSARSPQSQARAGAQLIPLPPSLSVSALLHLVEITGRPVAMLEFTLDLMLALGILGILPRRRLRAKSERWREFLSTSPAEQLVALTNAWLASPAHDLALIAGPHGPIQFHLGASIVGHWASAQPDLQHLRWQLVKLLTRGYGQHGGTTWHAVDALVDLLFTLDPTMLSGGASQQRRWHLSRPDGHRLRLEQREDAEDVLAPLLTALLGGPMSWLGLVEVRGGEGQTLYRPLPVVGLFAGRWDEPAAGSIVVEPVEGGTMPSILVPAGSADTSVHVILAALGELVSISPAGLHYRITADRVRSQFDAGLGLDDLVQGLARYTNGSLPASLLAPLERWWAGYGTIRLYDDITLIELADDLLLPELLATSRLESALIHTLSPRLIAVDPAQVESLVAELTRLGHTPRVLEGAR